MERKKKYKKAILKIKEIEFIVPVVKENCRSGIDGYTTAIKIPIVKMGIKLAVEEIMVRPDEIKIIK